MNALENTHVSPPKDDLGLQHQNVNSNMAHSCIFGSASSCTLFTLPNISWLRKIMVSLFILKMMEFVQIQLCARHFSEECVFIKPLWYSIKSAQLWGLLVTTLRLSVTTSITDRRPLSKHVQQTCTETHVYVVVLKIRRCGWRKWRDILHIWKVLIKFFTVPYYLASSLIGQVHLNTNLHFARTDPSMIQL